MTSTSEQEQLLSNGTTPTLQNYLGAPSDSRSINQQPMRPKHMVLITILAATLSVILVLNYAGVGKTFLSSGSDESLSIQQTLPVLKPLSTLDPSFANSRHIARPEESSPGEVWGKLRELSANLAVSLPTNDWWQNIVLGFPNQNKKENAIITLPYAVDTAGDISGLRIHFPKVFPASDRIVLTQYDWRHAFQLGSIRSLDYHQAVELGPLSVTLQWNENAEGETYMRAPIVRGSPYITMEYVGVEPMIMLRQEITQFIVDGTEVSCTSEMSTVTVTKIAEMVFSGYASSDNTWLLFVSEPVEFSCLMTFVNEADGSVAIGDPAAMPQFTLIATTPMANGVIRAALASTCSTGSNTISCSSDGIYKNEEYTNILKNYSGSYPSGQARVSYTSTGSNWVIEDTPLDNTILSKKPELKEPQDEGLLQFIWEAKNMYQPAKTNLRIESSTSSTDLLMYSLPHHRETLQGAQYLSQTVSTLHGNAQLVVGDVWNFRIGLPTLSFLGMNPVKDEMVDDINAALDEDLSYEIPENYLKGAGDTYFSGKLLAKLGRIALIAEEMGRHDEATAAAKRLADAAKVWFDGTAQAPLLYDYKWGGIVSCGCYFDGETQGCSNDASADECPALYDAGLNFGAGFYNDHHFHYGYFIYAAAIIAKFDPEWAQKYYEPVLLLVRDIANPSAADPYFPMFRHKDWFLGSSWASGIVTINGMPYPDGRNQESSSEAVNAYDAIALFGQEMNNIFEATKDDRAETAAHIRDTGRMLSALEMRAAQMYWQVKDVDTPNQTRIYPPQFRGNAVGMLWNSSAIMQTWFGTELWKVIGIQMLPITGISEQLLEKVWVDQMLSDFELSCLDDINPAQPCVNDGWSMLVNTAQAIAGNWEQAREGINALPESVFLAPGGNGHSRSNMLYFVATRP